MKHAVDPLTAFATKPFEAVPGEERIIRRADGQLTKVAKGGKVIHGIMRRDWAGES